MSIDPRTLQRLLSQDDPFKFRQPFRYPTSEYSTRNSFPPDYLFALIKGFWGLAVFNEAWSKGCLWAVTVRSCHGIGLTHKTHT
jgi:hypothetical protein